MSLKQHNKKILQLAAPDYRLGKNLGAGGNAQVYAAKCSDGTSVAIKFMLNVDLRRYSRFRDEVLVVTSRLKDLNHVVPIIKSNLPELVQDGVIPWYVMPVATGVRKYLLDSGPTAKLNAIAALADGLAVLHENEVAHRDIKPENLFHLDGCFRFGDFGIAKFPERMGLTTASEPMGPMGYMAPEMMSTTEDTDAKPADVYSLAKTLWVILTKMKYPFAGQYAHDAPCSLERFIDDESFVYEPIEVLLARCTDAEPTRRPTASEFAKILKEIVLAQDEFRLGNPLQWQGAIDRVLAFHDFHRVEWADCESIARVITQLSRRTSLNHCLLPGGGGVDLTGARPCEGGAMIALEQSPGSIVVKPFRLTLEIFSGGPELSYAVLETLACGPLGGRYKTDRYEALWRFDDYDYMDASFDDTPWPDFGEVANRYFEKAVFIITPKGGVLNRIDFYQGKGNALGRDVLRRELEKHFNTEQSEGLKNGLLRETRILPKPPQKCIEFKLEYIGQDLLDALIQLDDKLVAERDAGRVNIYKYNSANIFDEYRERRSSGPSEAQLMIDSMSPHQRSEYLTLILVGRGDVDDLASLSLVTASNLGDRFRDDYLIGKLGNGYLRRALSRFGLRPANLTKP